MVGLLLGVNLVGIHIDHICGHHRIAVDRIERIEQLTLIFLYQSRGSRTSRTRLAANTPHFTVAQLSMPSSFWRCRKVC